MKKRTANYLGRNFNKKRRADRMSKEARSALMSKIRSQNTKFEKDFIILVKRKVKCKTETHVIDIRGKPDIVIQRKKVCIFLDSDFWHGWYYPKWKHLLKNKYWRDKIEKNRKRDKMITNYLRKNGWIVIRIWEHGIKKNPTQEINKINNLLRF